MRQEEFTKAAHDASVRYTNFLDNLRNAYNRTILSAKLNPKTLNTFRKEVTNLQQIYLEKEVEQVTELHGHLSRMIHEDTFSLNVEVLEDDEWGDYLYQNANFLFEAIKLQSAKDALYINNFLRTKILEIMALDDYKKAYNLVFDSKDLSFFYTDKIGRRINSVKYVRTLTRDFMVGNYNDMLAGAAILNDINKVTIENPDEAHKDNGKTISINGDSDVNYFSIRTEIFHPNSNSIIKVI